MSSGPNGDAIEAKKSSGGGFFSENGELLSVIFDEVQSDNDHQILEFDRDRIEIVIKNNQVNIPKEPGKSVFGLERKLLREF